MDMLDSFVGSGFAKLASLRMGSGPATLECASRTQKSSPPFNHGDVKVQARGGVQPPEIPKLYASHGYFIAWLFVQIWGRKMAACPIPTYRLNG